MAILLNTGWNTLFRQEFPALNDSDAVDVGTDALTAHIVDSIRRRIGSYAVY